MRVTRLNVFCSRDMCKAFGSIDINPALLANNSVLDLGSGTGFLGLIVADIQVGQRRGALCCTSQT